MLPRMTKGNWVFWAVMVWIGINFIWLKFFEKFVTQWVGVAIATVAAALLIKFGPLPEEETEEEEEE